MLIFPRLHTSGAGVGIQVFQISSPALFPFYLDSSLPIKFRLTWGPPEPLHHPKHASFFYLQGSGMAKVLWGE